VLGVGAYFQLIPGQNLLLVNGRPKGLFKDPNVFGPYLVPMALYAFSRLEQLGASWLQRLLWGSSGLMAMAGIFFSYSRACWTNFLCATAAYLGLGLLLASKGRQLKMRGLVVALVIAAMLLLLAAAVSIPAVYNMLQLRLGHKGLQGYDQLRFYTHDLAWQSAYDHPFGIGPGQSEAAFQYATHSTLLRVLSENGFLGAAAFIGLVFASLGRSLYVAVTAADDQWRTISLVVFASILGVVVNSAVIDSVHWRHLWFLLGLAWVSRRRAVEVEMGWGVRAAQPGGALAWQPWERGV
jgi:hypothetical protein